MNVYRLLKAEDEASYGDLYRRCRALEGAEYIGSLPQSELTSALKNVAVLAYPNTFPETGCIAAMEAMAAGCWIVTSDLGALRETTAGFARLVPIKGVTLNQFKDDFVAATVEVLRNLANDSVEAHLRRQVAFVNQNVTWTARAQEWTDWLRQICQEAIQLDPSVADAHYKLGNDYLSKGDIANAIASYQEAVRVCPSHADAWNNLGILHFSQDRVDDALACFRQALLLRPDSADAHYNLANATLGQGDLSQAEKHFQEAIRIKPGHVNAHNNLASVFSEKGALDEAVATLQQALRLNPNYTPAYTGLGNAYKDQGRLDAALACFRRSQELDPQNPTRSSNELLCLHYHPGYDATAIFAAHRRWEQRLRELGIVAGRAFTNQPAPDRQLRIGYLSPDFRNHVVGRNVWPLIRCYDRKSFEIVLYSNAPRHDEMSGRFRSHADLWCPVFGWPDEQLVSKIRDDGIDILIDLALHTTGNRLTVFARKPAPVQVTFAGYPGTTGLSAIDYRLTDPYLDPPGMFDACYAESSVRLPHSFWCYDPDGTEPEVAPLPALKNGFVTFGCFNNFCKINEAVLDLWPAVLAGVPSSRLLLVAKRGSHRQRTIEFFESRGISRGQIDFHDPLLRAEFLRLYHRIDIGLDTFPYNGHTTSLESLWMGIPVVTVVGQTVVGRGGLSQLSSLGLDCLAASTNAGFVKIATNLAGDLAELKALREGLRRRMAASPLTDAAQFAHGIEDAYRVMWRKWCATRAGRT